MRLPQGEDRSKAPVGVRRDLDARVKTVIALMHRWLGDRLPVQRLSKSVNLSPARLRELFRDETGKSPVQYLRNLRIQRAEQLLQDTFLSVKEIAFLSGMRDMSHFVRDFKRQNGLTPTEFRARRGSSPTGLIPDDRNCE
jgi:transcriptional regulator GlxA family with amidase domain